MNSAAEGALHGACAAAAWNAYLANKSRFPAAERFYALQLPPPATLLLAAPEHSVLSSSFQSIEDLQVSRFPRLALRAAESLADRAFAAVLLSDASDRRTRELLYVHARVGFRGRGSVDRLLAQAQAQAEAAGETLQAHRAACQTWHASLTLLRNMFVADEGIHSSTMPPPGTPPSSRSSCLTFTWRSGRSLPEHVRYLRAIVKSQRRRSEGLAFADALQQVVDRMLASEDAPEDASEDAPPPAPEDAPPPAQPLKGALPPGWLVEQCAARARVYKRYRGPDARGDGGSALTLAGAWRVFQGVPCRHHDRTGLPPWPEQLGHGA